MGAWVTRATLISSENHLTALLVGILSGLAAFFILNFFFKLLLKNESNVNWSMQDALFKTGVVYLKIPKGEGNGIITIDLNGASRELKAKSINNKSIPTGAQVRVVKVEKEFAVVEVEQS